MLSIDEWILESEQSKWESLYRLCQGKNRVMNPSDGCSNLLQSHELGHFMPVCILVFAVSMQIYRSLVMYTYERP